jgi:hypothetical protein
MNEHSNRRAVTYPSASSSLCRLTIGKITTAVPMFAMMSSSSRRAPKKIRLDCPPPAMYPTGSSSTGWKSNSAGIEVTNVMRKRTPPVVDPKASDPFPRRWLQDNLTVTRPIGAETSTRSRKSH